MKRIPVCNHCGSEDVSADAIARWDDENQDWKLIDVYDKGYACDQCGGECRIDWKEIKTIEEELIEVCEIAAQTYLPRPTGRGIIREAKKVEFLDRFDAALAAYKAERK